MEVCWIVFCGNSHNGFLCKVISLPFAVRSPVPSHGSMKEYAVPFSSRWLLLRSSLQRQVEQISVTTGNNNFMALLICNFLYKDVKLQNNFHMQGKCHYVRMMLAFSTLFTYSLLRYYYTSNFCGGVSKKKLTLGSPIVNFQVKNL